MFEAMQITLVTLLILPTLALVLRTAVLYFRWRKEKTTSRPER